MRLQWALVCGLALGGCGREEGDSVPVVAPAASTITAGQPTRAPRWLDAQAIPSTEAADSKEAVLDPNRLAQLSALPHLSALSAREKAGLLLLLPPMSPAERLVLIDMYPSLVRLPVQQKQILLDKLEQIVPVANAAQPR
jgi:hypothetical protein